MAYYDEGPWAILSRECDCDDCYHASQQPLDLLDDDSRVAMIEELALLEGWDA